MQDLSLFITQNLYLSLAFIVVVLVYIIFELNQIKNKTFNITTAEAIRLTNKEKGVFLDIRNEDDFNAGHIVGAIHVTTDNLKQVPKQLKKHLQNPIVVYCNSGQQAKTAVNLLKQNGFTKATVLNGGFGSWTKEGLPVDKKQQNIKLNKKQNKEDLNVDTKKNSEKKAKEK